MEANQLGRFPTYKEPILLGHLDLSQEVPKVNFSSTTFRSRSQIYLSFAIATQCSSLLETSVGSSGHQNGCTESLQRFDMPHTSKNGRALPPNDAGLTIPNNHFRSLSSKTSLPLDISLCTQTHPIPPSPDLPRLTYNTSPSGDRGSRYVSSRRISSREGSFSTNGNRS
ncbi:hypothetical protein PM082_023651 [Marasmius tenuissimus]|nr:hypothetical protein PM082_023651 [Marasmius tenuissimus]